VRNSVLGHTYCPYGSAEWLYPQPWLRRQDAKDQLVLRLAGAGSEAAIATRLSQLRPMFADHVSRGLIQPLAVEWVKTSDLRTNPRTGKLMRLLDERGA
jgi:phenylacetate-CoA ligase